MDRPSVGDAAALTHLQSVPGIYSAYIWKNVCFMFWFAAATPEACVAFERACRMRAAEYPQGVSVINVMVPGSNRLPEPAVRAEFTRIMREYRETTAAVAVVIPGNGFWTSAVRSMIAALAMMRPRGLPLQVFGGAADMAQWLGPLHSERTGVPLQAATLQAMYEQAERAASSHKAA